MITLFCSCLKEVTIIFFIPLFLFCGGCNSFSHSGISCHTKGRNVCKKESPNCDKLSEGFICGVIPCFSINSPPEGGRGLYFYFFLCVFVIWGISTEKANYFAEREVKIFLLMSKTKTFQTSLSSWQQSFSCYWLELWNKSDGKCLMGLNFLRSSWKLLAYCPVQN